MDAVVLNDSPLVGGSASSICLRRQYAINLIAVAGHDAKNLKRLHHIIFHPGDVLLVQGLRDLPQGFWNCWAACHGHGVA